MADHSQPPAPIPNRPLPVAGRLARLALKELREILRDHRTILTLVLMPLLVYPLLSIGFRQFFLASTVRRSEPVYRVGFASEAEGTWLNRYLDRYADLGSSQPPVEFFVVDDLQQAVEEFHVDLSVRLRDFEAQAVEDRPLAVEAELLFVPGYLHGERALEHLDDLLVAANQAFLAERLAAAGFDEPPVPVAPRPVEVGQREGLHSASIVTLLPLVLILMTITGAVYPAIDLTAGERERGTLEILVAAPVPRVGLLLAKYVSVLAVAMLTATVNLVSMTVTIMASGLGPLLLGEGGWSLGVVAQIFLLLLLFAAFFSAVLLSMTSFARSFKEAQAYLIPLVLLSLAPGLLSVAPGWELKGSLAVAPLINIVLLGRDMLRNQADLAMASVVVMSTFLYAGAAVAIAARLFGSEDVLFSSGRSWSDLFRRARTSRPAPSVASALVCLALLFPAFFLITGIIGQQGRPLVEKLLLSALGTAVLFAGFPALAAWLRRDPPAATFGLRRPALMALAGGLLLGVSLWAPAHELVVAQHESGLLPLDEAYLQRVQALVGSWREQLPLAGLLVALAVLPGVCEELFFRGYLFRALRASGGPRTAILGSAVLFGLFHLVTTDALAAEKLLPSTLLGLVLGWVAYRSGSIFPGMLLHVCHNGLLVTAAYYQPWLTVQGIGTEQTSHLPLLWLVAAAAAAALGAWLVRPAREPLPVSSGEALPDTAEANPLPAGEGGCAAAG